MRCVESAMVCIIMVTSPDKERRKKNGESWTECFCSDWLHKIIHLNGIYSEIYSGEKSTAI